MKEEIYTYLAKYCLVKSGIVFLNDMLYIYNLSKELENDSFFQENIYPYIENFSNSIYPDRDRFEIESTPPEEVVDIFRRVFITNESREKETFFKLVNRSIVVNSI